MLKGCPMKNLIAAALVALVSLTAACSNDSTTAPKADRCTRGVEHVFNLTLLVGKPSADEQRAMDAIKQQSLTQCRSEGLSQAQLDCILATKDIASMSNLEDCGAIKAKRPGWLLIP